MSDALPTLIVFARNPQCLQEFEAAHDKLPPTKTVRCAGGLALFFKKPAGFEIPGDRKEIAPGVTIYSSVAEFLADLPITEDSGQSQSREAAHV